MNDHRWKLSTHAAKRAGIMHLDTDTIDKIYTYPERILPHMAIRGWEFRIMGGVALVVHAPKDIRATITDIKFCQRRPLTGQFELSNERK